MLDKLVDENRNDILQIAARHGAYNVRVFGSRARGEATQDSDLDLLIDIEPGRSLLDIVALKQDMEDALGCQADVLTERAISPYMRERILREAVPLEMSDASYKRPTVGKEFDTRSRSNMPDDWAYLRHILEAAGRIEEYISIGRDQFLLETLRQDATIRQLEVIGEAVKRLSPSIRIQYPGVPWRQIAGTRDVLIHDYMGVDIDRVWEIATREVPELKHEVERVLSEGGVG